MRRCKRPRAEVEAMDGHARCERRRLWSEAGRAHDEAALGLRREVCVKGTDVQTIVQKDGSEKFLRPCARKPSQPMRGAPEPKISEEEHGGPRQRRTISRAFRNGDGSPPVSFPSFRPLAHAGRLWSSCTLPPSLLAVAGPVSPRPNTHPRNDPAASDGTSPLTNHSRAPGQRTSAITNGDSHVGEGDWVLSSWSPREPRRADWVERERERESTREREREGTRTGRRRGGRGRERERENEEEAEGTRTRPRPRPRIHAHAHTHYTTPTPAATKPEMPTHSQPVSPETLPDPPRFLLRPWLGRV